MHVLIDYLFNAGGVVSQPHTDADGIIVSMKTTWRLQGGIYCWTAQTDITGG